MSERVGEYEDDRKLEEAVNLNIPVNEKQSIHRFKAPIE